METTLGKDGLKYSWQEKFKANIKCVHCGANSRIGFVAHEGIEKESKNYVCHLYNNGDGNKLWLHDCCAVAVYFCEKCLEPTADYNQG